ncbi:MAG: Jag N-terminal domain-containing protein [Desulfomonile tiedjei]|nr:Jag N-terminal domain-containing protein [Desulfomonile tiedjei]
MTWYEFTGRSVKEAIAKACEELNAEEPLLDIEVLEESTRGFLGIVGHRDARVRVRKRDILREVTETAEPPESAEGAGSEARLRESAPRPDVDALEGSADEREESGEALKAVESRVDPSPFVEGAREILQGMLDRIPVAAQVEATTANGAVYLDIKGDGSGLLIGKKGQTLDALQFLVNKIVNKANPPGSKVEVVVDTENYRARKQENLRETALRSSEKAKRSLKPVSLTPMPAHERRIIHLILADDREVYTKSYGEGALRRIIVYPRRGTINKRRRR